MHAANVMHTPGSRMKLKNKNLARKLRRTLLGVTKWAPEYLAQIRVLNRFTEREAWETVAMQLPHEVLHLLMYFGDGAKLREVVAMDPESFGHLLKCKALSQIPIAGTEKKAQKFSA